MDLYAQLKQLFASYGLSIVYAFGSKSGLSLFFTIREHSVQIREETVLDKTSWVRNMLKHIQPLAQMEEETFISDLYPAAAESYLRRALEALLDLGRHICAKGFHQGCQEYKEISYC